MPHITSSKRSPAEALYVEEDGSGKKYKKCHGKQY